MPADGHLARCGACAIVAGSCATAAAEVVSSDAYVHYPIAGASAAELRREMNAKGPLTSDGRRFDGYTRWNINWTYTYRESNGGCRIATVTVNVKTTMTLPDWQSESAGPQELRAQWRSYRAALEEHEKGHRANGLDAARDIDRGIGALPAQTSCRELGAIANALGGRIIGQYNERDLDYDRRTEHGRTQGARFP